MTEMETPAPAKPLWTVRLPDGRWVCVEALSKSEARAAAKRELKIRLGLPAGTTCSKW